jgi:hypothetical protein
VKGRKHRKRDIDQRRGRVPTEACEEIKTEELTDYRSQQSLEMRQVQSVFAKKRRDVHRKLQRTPQTGHFLSDITRDKFTKDFGKPMLIFSKWK